VRNKRVGRRSARPRPGEAKLGNAECARIFPEKISSLSAERINSRSHQRNVLPGSPMTPIIPRMTAEAMINVNP